MTPALRRAALMAPGLGWLALFLLVPCLLVLALSFFERGVYGGVDYVFTFENYRRAVEPLYRSILLNSAWLAFLATAVSALVGYPAAYAISKAPQNRQAALLVLVMLPFWSNYLIRTYAWIVLLNREGLINRTLAALGASEPLPLLYNDFAIVLGLVYGYLPFMVLAIYASLSRLDPALLEQSADLGASRVSTFLRITLPLTLPGLAAGSAFVFVLSIGNFITPDLLGGGRRLMVGNLIYKQFLAARDWPFGAALAFLLIAIMMLLLFAQALAVRKSGGERPA
jgi:spermidine/putrescine transport system permease protein